MNGLHAVVYLESFVAIQSTEDRQLHCSTLYVQLNAFIEAHYTRFCIATIVHVFTMETLCILDIWNDSDNTFA